MPTLDFPSIGSRIRHAPYVQFEARRAENKRLSSARRSFEMNRGRNVIGRSSRVQHSFRLGSLRCRCGVQTEPSNALRHRGAEPRQCAFVRGRIRHRAFRNRIYYSLSGSAAAIWIGLCASFDQSEVKPRLAPHAKAGPDAFATAVDRFVAELQAAGLTQPTAKRAHEAWQPVAPTGGSALPQVKGFSDMQDLLLLDPVHDTTRHDRYRLALHRQRLGRCLSPRRTRPTACLSPSIMSPAGSRSREAASALARVAAATRQATRKSSARSAARLSRVANCTAAPAPEPSAS